MTMDELKNALDSLKDEGYEEKDILGILYLMYADGKMPLEDLRTMTETLGYEFTEEFEAMSEEDKKKNGLKKAEKAAEGVDNEEVEDAKEYEGEGDDDKKAVTAADTENKKDDEEDDDDKKAARLFGFDKDNK